MARTLEEIQKELNSDLPGEWVRQLKQAGIQLSYVDGYTVYDELNRIIGPGRWGSRVERLEMVDEHQDEAQRWRVSSRCVAELWFTLPQEKDVENETHRMWAENTSDVGHGHGIDKSKGHAYESAEKEAVTDAVKRCARTLGRRMGLALYDKSQAHVTGGKRAYGPYSKRQ